MRILSKSIADSQFFSNNSFTYFWKSFHLFPDHLISKAEDEIRHHEDKRTPSSSSKGPQRFHPFHPVRQTATTGSGQETRSSLLETTG